MYLIHLPSPESLHRRGDREAYVNLIRYRVGAMPPRRLYRIEFVFRGKFFKPDGTPTKRDTDNLLKPLFDCMAKAFGFDDCWLQRDYTVRCEQSDDETVTVTML